MCAGGGGDVRGCFRASCQARCQAPSGRTPRSSISSACGRGTPTAQSPLARVPSILRAQGLELQQAVGLTAELARVDDCTQRPVRGGHVGECVDPPHHHRSWRGHQRVSFLLLRSTARCEAAQSTLVHVTCDRVRSILNSNHLSGTLQSSLGAMTGLQQLCVTGLSVRVLADSTVTAHSCVAIPVCLLLWGTPSPVCCVAA